MQAKHLISSFSAVLLSLLLSPAANAKFFWEKEEKKPERKTYVFAAYGSYNSEGDDIDNDDRYHEFGLGAKLSKHFGVEGVFTDFGSFSGDIAEGELRGFSANVVGYFPLSNYLDVYLKGGIFFGDFDMQVGGLKESYKDEKPTLGIGLNIEVSDPLTLFAEFSHYKVSVEEDDLITSLSQTDYNFNTLKVGARFMF